MLTAGAVSIDGDLYEDTVRDITASAILSPGDRENIVTITDATLITPANGEDITSKILAYYEQRLIKKFKTYTTNNIITGQTIKIGTFLEQTIHGQIERTEIDLSGGFVAKFVLIGDQVKPIYSLHAGVLGAGETRLRQRSWRPGVDNF